MAIHPDDSVLNQRVIANWGAGGGVRATGICVAYTLEPTIIIQLEDGTQIHWVASLCELESRDE